AAASRRRCATSWPRRRHSVADWNKDTIDRFRAQGGKGVGPFGDKLLLLTTRGAKSGTLRTTPLVYHRDGDRYVIAASKGGAPSHPSWYHNLVKHPDAEIEVGADRASGRLADLLRRIAVQGASREGGPFCLSGGVRDI